MSLQIVTEFFYATSILCVLLVNEHFLLVFPPYLQSAIEYCIDLGT